MKRLLLTVLLLCGCSEVRDLDTVLAELPPTQSEECRKNELCVACQKRPVLKQTFIPANAVHRSFTIPVSYQAAAITPREMVECGWYPMPNDVCFDQKDCAEKARWQR